MNWPFMTPPVSILVFLELAPGHIGGRKTQTRSCVSILVFLELAPGLDGAERRRRDDDVSILVFLELAPGRRILQPYLAINISFNPCFSGTRARTGPGNPHLCRQTGFQSLFFWNSRPDMSIVPDALFPSSFQSLFFWNSRPDLTDTQLFS